MDVPTELIKRLQAKDPAAYGEFMERYGRRLLNFGMRMCGDKEDAREVVQDTLLKTFESVHELKNREAFAGWLYRIATNACLMKRRKSKFLAEEVALEDVMPERAALSQGGPAWNRLPTRQLWTASCRTKSGAPSSHSLMATNRFWSCGTWRGSTRRRWRWPSA